MPAANHPSWTVFFTPLCVQFQRCTSVVCLYCCYKGTYTYIHKSVSCSCRFNSAISNTIRQLLMVAFSLLALPLLEFYGSETSWSLPPSLPPSIPTYLPTYIYRPTYLHIPPSLPPSIPTYLYLPTYLPTYSYRPTYTYTYLHNFLESLSSYAV